MRILYVTAHYPPDFVSGATLQVQRLAEHAAVAGHHVAVFSGAIRAGLADGATADEPLNGVDVRWLGTSGWIEQDDDRNWDNPVATSAGAALLDEFEPDVVHAHALQTLGAGVVDAAIDRGIRVLLTMHDLWWWCSRLFLVDRDMQPCPLITDVSGCACARTADWRLDRARSLRRTLDRVDEILVPSRSLRDLVIANGVDPSRVSVDENDVAVSPRPRRRSEAHDDVRFAYVGGDHPVKGVEVVLEAARHLKRVAGWQLTCFGVAERRMPGGVPIAFEPPYKPDEAGDVLSAADVLVIPSIARESFSIAAREALAAGTAVVTSDCVGPEEVVRHGENGFVVPTADAAALAGTMRHLVDDRHLLAQLQGAAARNAPELRTPSDHSSALLARYGEQPRHRAAKPNRVALVADGAPSARTLRIAAALELHGIDTRVAAASDRRLDSSLADADALVICGALPPVTAQSVTEAARQAGAVVIDDSRISDGVGAADIVATSGVDARRPRRILGATTLVTVVASARSDGRTVEAAVRAVVDSRRRTQLNVVVASDVERLRGADIVVVPPTDDAGRAWMLASLVGATSIVGDDLASMVEHGRTALVAPSRDDWPVHLTMLLDDPILRKTIASAARREVMLHHGPHALANAVLDAFSAASRR